MLLINALRYKAWADARSLAAAARLDAHRFAQQDAFIRQQFNHMVRVEEVFRARLLAQPEPHTSTNSETVPPLQALHERLTASNHWLQAYLVGPEIFNFPHPAACLAARPPRY